MAEKSRLKVTFLNRYYPPNNSVTGNSAYELAEFLSLDSNLLINSVSFKTDYDTAKSEQNNLVGNNYYLNTPFRGKNKILRLIFNLYEGYLLLKKAIKINSNVIVTLTDPPLLTFWAALLLRKRNIKWVSWTMDLYPDAFVAAGLASNNNIFVKYLRNKIKSYHPDLVITLGGKQKQYLISNYYDNKTNFVELPCGIHDEVRASIKPDWTDEKKLVFAYAGNLGEAHSEIFLLKFIEALNPNKHKLILSTYGSKSKEVLKVAKSNKAVQVLKRLNKEDFIYVDIHLVSLLPNWNHVCVPSKAVSAICAGSPILFFGNQQADTYSMLKDALYYLSYSEDNLEIKVEGILTTIEKDNIVSKKEIVKKHAQSLNLQKNNSFKEIQSIMLRWLKEK